jgi:hypothetical protein
MIEVRPWFDLPRPIPSCQPIFCSNLLPTLSDPIPAFVGSSYETEAASCLVFRYFSCREKIYHNDRSQCTSTTDTDIHMQQKNLVTKAVYYVRLEVFTAVTVKNGVFWVVTPCGSCKNRRFGGTWCLLHQGDKNR